MFWKRMLLVYIRSIFLFIRPVILSSLTVTFFSYQSKASGQVIDFNTNCRNAYHQIHLLKINSATQLINAEKKTNPGNPVIPFLEHYRDFMIFFIDEKKPEYTTFINAFDDRLDKVKSANSNTPYYNFLLAEMNLLAAVSRVKTGEYFSAAWEVRRAFLLLEENQKKYPSFIANYKSLGVLHAMVGTIPDQYQWVVKIMGLSGSVDQGMAEIKSVVDYSAKDPQFIFKDETNIMYVFGLLYLKNNQQGAYNFANELLRQSPDNLMNYFLYSSTAMPLGKNDEIISTLMKYPKSTEYFRFSYLNYMIGICKLRRLDKDANIWLEKFLIDKDRQGYVKEAYQKLSWYYFLNGNTPEYNKAVDNILTNGNTTVDSDKQAEREALAKEKLNAVLLRARLLCDGGYYQRAIAELQGKSMNDFKEVNEQIEFTYRAGRIYDQWGQPDKAIPYYNATIKYGSDLPYHYAANAALSLGQIYEAKKDYMNARKNYHRCIDMKNEDFKSGLDQKAKAGLSRIKGK